MDAHGASLCARAQELTDKRRRSATINWQNRKDVRARMMAMVMVLLADTGVDEGR